MKIFDGVQVNPATLSPAWQGVLGVAMLVANTYIEADKVRAERVAREHAQRQEPTTLSDVMEQSGLKIPHLRDALTAFMGGTEEAKDAATLIVNMPDPVKLLRDFARQHAPACAANGPIVAPAAAPARPMPASSAPSATSTNNAATSNSPRPKPAAFRPEFTREGLEAAARARAAEPRPKPAAFRPEFTREGLEAAARARAANQSAPTTPATAKSLADALAERLDVLTRKMDAHHAELDSRIRCAEAEIAALREELQNLRVSSDGPILFVVPSIDEEKPLPIDEAKSSPVDAPSSAEDVTIDEAPAVVASSADDVEGSSATPEAPTVTETDTPLDHPAVLADATEPMSAAVHPNDDALAETACRVPNDLPPLPPGTPEDLALAFSMLGKFTDQAEARYAGEAERMRALELRLSHLRGVVERSRRSAAGHG